MKDVLALLQGRKTYIVAAIALVYAFGGDQEWWVVSDNVWRILEILGLAAIRSGINSAISLTQPQFSPPPK